MGKLSILKEGHEIASLKQKRSLADSTIFATEPGKGSIQKEKVVETRTDVVHKKTLVIDIKS